VLSPLDKLLTAVLVLSTAVLVLSTAVSVVFSSVSAASAVHAQEEDGFEYSVNW